MERATYDFNLEKIAQYAERNVILKKLVKKKKYYIDSGKPKKNVRKLFCTEFL